MRCHSCQSACCIKMAYLDNGKRLLYCTTPLDSNQRASRRFKLKWGRTQFKFLQCFAALGFEVSYLFRHGHESSLCAAYIRTIGNIWPEMRTFSSRKKHYIFNAATSQSYFQAVAFALRVNDRFPKVSCRVWSFGHKDSVP
jgi:hypothetical protein